MNIVLETFANKTLKREQKDDALAVIWWVESLSCSQ